MKKSFSKKPQLFTTILMIIFMTVFAIGCSQNMVSSNGGESGLAESQPVSASINSAVAGVVNKPYPQHVAYPGTNFTKPAYTQAKIDADVVSYFTQWRQMYIVPYNFTNGARDASGTGYIIKADANGDIYGWGTVKPASQSEAMGYAMILFAIMSNHDPDSQAIFDGMFDIHRNFPCKDNAALMSWAIPEGGDLSLPRLASATDGDMDIAYAMLLADKQWGSTSGKYNYLEEAKKIIDALEVNAIFTTGPNVYYPRLNIGDNDPTHNYGKFKATRSSDWILTHTDAFYKVTGKQIWKDLQDVMIKIAADKRNPTTGLIADFYGDTAAGVMDTFEGISDESNGVYDNDYYYNSCRFPWRMAMGYAHLNLAQPRQFSESITSWLVGKFSTGGVFDPALVTAGYELNGTQLSPGGYQWDADAFNGPFLAGMSVSGSQYQSAITSMWDNVMDFEGIRVEWGKLVNNYFDDTLSLMSLLFVSGNWWNPTDIGPTRPQAPTNLSVVSTTETEIVLDWADNTETDLKEYKVYRKLPSESVYQPVATVLSSTFTDTGLQQSTTYQYVVTAVNTALLESMNSNMVEGTTSGPELPPAKPTGLTGVALSQTEIKLDWNANSETNIKEYVVFRKLASSTAAYSRVTAVTGTTYTDSALVKDTMYEYVITAVSTSNLSSVQSDPVQVKTKGDLPPQEIVVTLKKTGGWGTTVQGEFIVQNNSQVTVDTWTLILDLDFTISSFWCGTISNVGSTYTVKPSSWNGTLAPGASANVGFIGTGVISQTSVTNATINGTPVTVTIIN